MFSRLLALRKFLGGHEVLLLWISISIVLTLTGPFGTFEHMPIRIRAIYWPGLIAVALVFAGFISNSVPSFAASWPRPALEILRVAVFTMGFAPFVVIVSVQLSPEVTLAAAPWPYMVAYVLVITTAISVVRQSVIASLHDLQRDTQEPEITMAYPLLRRLPAGANAEIVRLSVSDHYVQVHLADKSTHRILMRFVDAIAEMTGADGHCTHRSHWVVTSHVQRAERNAGRDFLYMSDCAVIPVSRKYRPNLVEAGILKPIAERNRKAATPRQNSHSLS